MAGIYEQKFALLTGGSSGIGLALAKELVSNGANVAILARRPDQLNLACAEIEKLRVRADQLIDALPGDIANREQIFSILEAFIQKRGTPDYLFNCAGIVEPGLFEDQPAEVFDRMMEVNFIGTVNVIKAILPGMIQRGSGYIAIVGSGAGFLGTIGYAAYGASKFALRGLADVMRVELKPKGIKVSYVAPGDTDTPQLVYDNAHKPAITKAFVGNNSKVLSPEYVAKAILKDMARGRYFITPGFDMTLYYNLANTFGLVYPLLDFVLAQAWKQVNRTGGNGGKQHQA